MSEVHILENDGSASGRGSGLDGGTLAMIESNSQPRYQNDFEITFSNIAGVLVASDKARFERMLFRATRGNCYVRFAEIEEDLIDSNGAEVTKVAFVIFFKSDVIE
jgi:V-type H+-transporting ATPase subunit a